MAKEKPSISGKSTEQPKGKSWRNWFFYSLSLLILIVALIIWQWSLLTPWIAGTWRLLGWGLVLLEIALVGIIVMQWRRRILSFIRRIYQPFRYWYRWLGAVSFIFAIWGILAFFNLGGNFGTSIIGQPDFIGIIRVLGLVKIGIILVAPRAAFRLTAILISWLGKQLKIPPSPKPIPEQKAEVSPVIETPKPVAPTKKVVATVPISTQSPQELKQVAQEVWKKYGESSSLIIVDGWRLPPIDILDTSPEVEFSQADNTQRARLIEEALASYGVGVNVTQINAGPTVTQFGVEPGWDRKTKEIKEKDKDGNVTVRLEEIAKTRVKVERITSLANDMALALAAPSIRIEAPVPGKSVVGIEVPNTISSAVSLRGVVETSSFQKSGVKSKLTLALGKGAGGEAIVGDLTKMPHLLIAGATGSGKTVCLNSIICCLLLHNSPREVQFIMIDPKRVELTPFNSIPHLATPVIVDTAKALTTLRWLSQEMDKRYQELATASARNVESYNKNRSGDEKLPYLVLIIDELADLMMAGFDEVEHHLCRLAQLARATGIHLIVATQRPSVDVVTGLIKANFPTRISFAVTSQVDSRTILDSVGAEKLLGRGDMLYLPTEEGKPKRIQGCYVSDAETERLVYFWGNQRTEERAQLNIEELTPTTDQREGSPQDSLLEAARQLAQEHKHISTSFLQRRLRIGYPRAARIMEQLDEENERKEGQSD